MHINWMLNVNLRRCPSQTTRPEKYPTMQLFWIFVNLWFQRQSSIRVELWQQSVHSYHQAVTLIGNLQQNSPHCPEFYT